MMKLSTIFWIFLVTIAGAALFTISYSVKEKQEHLAQVKEDIVKSHDEVRVLAAEWSYLNQPARLEAMMHRYTSLQPTRHQQIVAFADVPFSNGPANDPAQNIAPDVKTASVMVAAASPTMKPILASTRASVIAAR